MLKEELPSFSDLSLEVSADVRSACLTEGEEQNSILNNKTHGYRNSSLFSVFDAKEKV